MTFEWVIGFYEGEGSAWMTHHNHPVLCFYQKEKQVLLKIRRFLKIGKIRRKWRPKQTYKVMWALEIAGKLCAQLLRKMLPYMQTQKKRKQTIRVLSTC